MKLKRLLHQAWLYAIALGWTSFAHAQTDVTSKYIKNAGFEESPVTYTTASGTTAQTAKIGKKGKIFTITNWTNASVCNNNAVHIATTEYGFSSAVDGTNGSTPPASDNNGATGVALAMSAGWGDDAIVEQVTNLPAGAYSLTYSICNQHSNTSIAVNFTGVKLADGSTKKGSLSSAAQGAWVSETIYFTVPTQQDVTIRIGFTTSTGGSGDGAKLYVDNLKLLKYEDAAFDMTSWIANAGFEQGTETTGGNKFNKPKGWRLDYQAAGWLDGSINTSNPSEGSNLYNLWAGQVTSLDLYQELSGISGLPVGKYRLSGDLRIDQTNYINDQGVYATINGTTYKSGTIKNVASTWNSLEGWNTLTTDFYISDPTATTRLGISSTGDGSSSKGWFQADNIVLSYLGKNLRDGSTSATSGVSATAGTWYAIPVIIAGTYTITPSAGTVYYTQNGEYMPDDAEAKATSVSEATNLELSVGYLYINASVAATITLVADIKEYTVGSATTSTNYIQAGQTVTVTYADATTNDESAKFARLTGDVTLNGTAVDVNVTGKSFTFTVPEGLNPATTYTLNIPARAFGYSGQTTCDAQEITFNTPAVFDGKYFIKATDATYGGKYISRGADSNTEAALDPWGLPVTITTDANNVSTIYFVDNNKPLVLNANNIAYTDGKLSNANHKYTYTITATSEGCTLYNIDKAKYLAAGVRNDNEVATASDDAYSWAIVTPANHTAEMTALKDKQAAAAAKAAGKTAATVAELKAIVEAWHGNTTENLTLTGDEFYSDAGNQNKAVGTRSNTVTISKAGLYKFSMPAYTRASSANEAYANHLTETEALVAYIFFGDYKTQIRSLYSVEGKTEATANYLQPSGAIQWWPNNTATGDTEFAAGKYANEIWMYLEAGDYTYGITNNSKGLCASWTYFNAPTLTYCSENSYAVFAELYKKCKPWTESTGSGDYVATYNSYARYADGTDYGLLNAAINYMNANFDTYAWDNASIEHPYDTKKIVNPSYDNGETGWSKTQNSTDGYNDGIDGNGNNYYYTASSQMRHATIYQEGITLKPGTYRLSANMYGDILNTTSTYIYATDGTVNHWADPVFAGNVWMGYLSTTNTWTNVSCYIVLTAETTLRIGALSWGVNRSGNTKGNFRVDDWKLEYVKYVVDNTDGVLTAYGEAPLAEINNLINAGTYVVDLSEATGLSNAAITTNDNPNMIIYAKSGAVSNSNNVVIDGTCANLVLTDGYPFTATKSFTATNASYTMSKVAETSSGATFGTLMLPYAVTTLPGKAYSLDQGVTYGGDIYATEVSSISANTPVLVTATGEYKATEASVAATADTYTNGELTGTYKAMTAEDNTFVLQKHDGYVAFFMVDAEKTTTKPTVNPFRAYIKAQSGASAKQFINVILDGETTGINNIDTDNTEANDIIYDLSGRKVTKAHKGVYIINGKKIIK